MVGKRSGTWRYHKDGAKMVNAVANSTVPKISIVIGNSYGAGNYAMCGKSLRSKDYCRLPTAKIAVMGGAQKLQKVLTQIQVSTLKGKGMPPNKEEEVQLYEEIMKQAVRGANFSILRCCQIVD